jgi:hypothetical protein
MISFVVHELHQARIAARVAGHVSAALFDRLTERERRMFGQSKVETNRLTALSDLNDQ